MTRSRATVEDQRAADAAFFEPWEEWRCLDDLPPRPIGRPRDRRWKWSGGPYSAYYCIPEPRSGRFAISIPQQHAIAERLRRIPGAVEIRRQGLMWLPHPV